ncbi:TPA: hypothetical protein ACGU4V_002814 [Vibrio vulnificus]|nr:hypothetical protein [Vibrio vulnificus]
MNTVTAPKPTKRTVTPPTKTRSRTIYYYRAEPTKSLTNKKATFESSVVASWNQLTSVASRVLPSEGKSLLGMDLEQRTLNINGKTEYCHVLTIGTTEKGALANIIEISTSSGKSTKIQAGTHSAPSGNEFLDGEAFVCLYGNHILISPCDALRGPISHRYLRKLLMKTKSPNASCFSLVQIANKQTVKTVMDEGVKRIDLNANVFMASFDRLKQNIKPNTFTSNVADAFSNLATVLMPAKTQSSILDYESLNTRLSVTHDLRLSSANANAEGDAVTENAKDLLDSHVEGFCILTKTGRQITHEKVVMKERVDIEAHGKSVKQSKIWDRMAIVMEKYYRDGVLAK